MNSVRLIGGCLRVGALAIAVASLLAGAATADVPRADVPRADLPRAEVCTADIAPTATPAALSRPVQLDASPDWALAAFPGLSCARCNSATQFCVFNPLRYEYACAPIGSLACISTERTSWCPAGRTCWAGRCQ